MSEVTHHHFREYLIFVALLVIALAFASQIDTITGMASTVTGTNSSLTAYDMTDYYSMSQGEMISFYANYTNISGSPLSNFSDAAACTVMFDDIAQSFNMSFNTSGTDVYEYRRTFPTQSVHSWNVTCSAPLYETLVVTDTVSVNSTYCGMSVEGSITLSSDLMMSNGSNECSMDGIIVNASDIMIDCAANEIAGTGGNYGIDIDGFDNISIINCDIGGFERGISLVSSTSDEARNNSLHGNSYGIYLDGSSGVFYYNTFASNALHAFADAPGSQFNTTVGGKAAGNSWDDTSSLMIFDSDADGYGDFGQQYPYNQSNGGKVSSNVTDWGPVASQTDSDGDGSPDSEDCDDGDASILAPRNDLLLTKNTTLCAGTYYLNDSLYPGILRFNSSSINLSCNNAVMMGNGTGSGIYDDKGGNVLHDCDVQRYYHGIHLVDSNSTSVYGVTVDDNVYAGIGLYNSSHNNLTGITAINNDNMGIMLHQYSEGNNLSGISAHDNYVGVYFYYADNNTLVDSDMYANIWYGLKVERSDQNTLRSIKHYSNLRGVYLAHAHSNNLTNISSYGNSDSGVLLWFSEGNTVYNVSSTGNTGSGIVVWTARDNVIDNSTFSSNTGSGLHSYISLSLKVYNSTMYDNTAQGIILDSSDNNTLEGNNISSNSDGILVNSSYDALIEGNKMLDNAGNGINVSDNSTLTILNNTLTGNSMSGIWVRDASAVNITNNTLCSNQRFGTFHVNSTLVPSYPDILTSNSFCTDNTLGLLSFNWYGQVHSFNRTGGNASNVSVNLTIVGEASPQHVTSTGNDSLTSRLILNHYIVNNSWMQLNSTYNITGVKGDFAGENITNVTENRIDSESDEIFLTLNRALPPTVVLVSPAANLSTTSHTVTFICNASHEGGLANISLYFNLTGNWTINMTNNVTGTANETSFIVTLPDAGFGWSCEATGLFNNSGFAIGNSTITVYTASSGGGGGGGGGGGEIASPPSEPPATPPTPPSVPPVTPPSVPPAPGPTPAPAPGPAAPVSAPASAAVDVVKTETSVSCDERVSVVEEDISLEELLKTISIPEGYRVIGKPFKANCKGGESFKMSIMVPDDMGNITALKCAGKGCSSRSATYTTRICPDKEVENFRKEDVLNISTLAVNVTRVQANMTESNHTLASGNYSLDFEGDVEASMSMATGTIAEPTNRNVKIVGVPIVIGFRREASQSPLVNVTIPYVLKPGDDESGVAVYAKRVVGGETRWIYVGGRVDTIKKVVRAEVNLSAYAEGDKVTLAPITMLCEECGEADFTNRFTPVPDSRRAIILLHGLWGMGKVWDSLVNEFRITNQPYQLWTFSYLATKPVDESAQDLINYLEANSDRYDKIYIVGYSLGGLVTQTALRKAADARLADPAAYTFMDKVGKVVLVATPNKGSPVANYLDTFLTEYINSEAMDIVPMSDAVKSLLQSGLAVEPVSNITYYSIAGTKPYSFMDRLGLTKMLFGDEPNDGLVSMSSAQAIGSTTLDKDCINFWSQPVIHTLLIDDRLVQKIIGQIITSDMFKELAADEVQTNLFGYSDYFELQIDDCSPEDLYVVIGAEKGDDEVKRAAYCACGNGVCDGLEDVSTCPDDCLVVEKPLIRRMVERSLSILALLLVLFLVGGFIFVLWEHKHKKKQPELPPGFNIVESDKIPPESLQYLSVEISNLRRRLDDVNRQKQVLASHDGDNGSAERYAALLKEAAQISERIRNAENELMKAKEAMSGLLERQKARRPEGHMVVKRHDLHKLHKIYNKRYKHSEHHSSIKMPKMVRRVKKVKKHAAKRRKK